MATRKPSWERACQSTWVLEIEAPRLPAAGGIRRSSTTGRTHAQKPYQFSGASARTYRHVEWIEQSARRHDVYYSAGRMQGVALPLHRGDRYCGWVGSCRAK